MPKFLDVTYPTKAVAALGLTTAFENIVGAYETETLALFDRMSVRPGLDNRTAINNLVKALKSSGVWAKLDGFYVLAAHTQADALINWVTTARPLVGSNSPTFTTNKGFTFNGSSSYLQVGPFSGAGLKMQAGDEMIGGWVRTNPSSAANDIVLGENASGGSSSRYLNPRSSVLTDKIAWKYNWSAGNRAAGLTRNTSGAANNLAVSMSRVSTSVAQVYANGALDDSNTTATLDNTRDKTGLYFTVGLNISTYSTRQYGAVWYGQGLTDNQHAQMYNALLDYMTALGALA